MTVVNPLAHLSDDELVADHCKSGANSHFLSEMQRRHMTASAGLGDKIWWLNFWLLVATVAILALTIVLVWQALRPDLGTSALGQHPARAVVQLSRQQFGIVLVFFGTLLLALAVKVRSTRPDGSEPVHLFGRIAPTEATIRPRLQWGGLALVALGSLLQW
jgi:hypothetical protein